MATNLCEEIIYINILLLPRSFVHITLCLAKMYGRSNTIDKLCQFKKNGKTFTQLHCKMEEVHLEPFEGRSKLLNMFSNA